jgi:hypothetical protein
MTKSCGIAAAVAFLAAGSPAAAFECRSAYLETTAYNTATGAVTGTGRYDFDMPDQSEFEAHTVVHTHIAISNEQCSGSLDADRALTLKGHRLDSGLAFVESWSASSDPISMVCAGKPIQTSIPTDAGKREFQLPEKDGAETEVIAKPPMTAKVHYTLRLRPTVPDLLSALKQCPITTDLVENAGQAAAGQAPTITCHTESGETSLEGNSIKLQYSASRCHMISELIQELSNAANRSGFEAVRAKAANGDLDRGAFIKAIEMEEFQGVLRRVHAIDQCGPTWACLTGELASWQKSTNFEQYFQGLASNNPDHLDYYGKDWDKKYKSQYDAKH